MKKVQTYLSALALCITLSACQPKAAKEGIVLVKVGDNILTMDELQRNVQVTSTPEDSMLFAENYIRLWVNNHLLYDVAHKNTTKADEADINPLVDNYRQSLTVYRYQEQLVNEKLAKEISEAALERFYKENQDLFQNVLPEDSTSFDYIKPTVKEMVINRRKMEFLKQVEDDLYQRALKNGTVVFYE
jgi:hypothetical protein